MTSAAQLQSREAVLDAFAVEHDLCPGTLERYLRLYPEHGGALVDLSRELNRQIDEDDAPLSAAEHALLDGAWARHAAAKPAIAAADPLVALTVDDWRAVAQRLDVPRQVATALRERRVSIVSIPKRILAHVAEVARSSVGQLEVSWGMEPLGAARAYKADGKPNVGAQVSFEQVLIEAGVSPEKRSQLLADAD